VAPGRPSPVAPARRTRAGAGALLLAAALLGAPPARAGEGNLVPNGGFERPAAGDANRPAGWTPHVRGKVSVAWSTNAPHGGRRCLEMRVDPNDRWGHAYWTSEPIRVRPCMAYRVRFHFRCEGFGVPCFSLRKIKEWRLFKGSTEGRWLVHEDVVVAPADLTETVFSVNNYHRPGKTMWLDDVRVVELPLSASPLTARLAGARRAVSAIARNVAGRGLTPQQRQALAAMRRDLAGVVAAYEKLRAGHARAEDFRSIHDGLEAVEKAVGAMLFTVWAVEPAERASRRPGPAAIAREIERTVDRPAEGPAACVLAVMSLVGESLPVRVTVTGDRGARHWRSRVLLRAAHAPPGGPWGEVNRLGTLLLPPGVPRLVRVEFQPPAGAPAKAGTAAAFAVRIEALDRPAASGLAAVRVRCAPGEGG
jgi:hypothetical protein